MLWTTVLFLLCSLVSSSSSLSSTQNRLEVIIARHGAVASDDGRCSRIGRDVLREGGHAVDASVAVDLCLGVVSPASSGIGGGSFMLVRSATGKAQAFDMRETAPLLAHQDMYAGNATLKASGALSIAVPGEIAGLYEAWRQHGKLPWKRLVMPAERLARRGFKISAYLHMQMDRTRSEILADEGLRRIFTSKGELLQIGDICRNIELAKTLRAISQEGPAAFYNGSIGINLVRDVGKLGGILTMEDMKTYKLKVKQPLSSELLGLKILGMPPPSSGGAGMMLILNILSLFGFPLGVSGSLGVHQTIEAIKHMFAVRMSLGDPDFVDVSSVVSDMLSPKFAEGLKKKILDNMTFSSNHYGGRWNHILDHGTSHLSIVDAERNAVSMTSTINSYFGSWILSPSTGIVLNNEMDDFSIPANVYAGSRPPAPANFIKPGKRPLSSMTPTIVLKDEQLKGLLGASGGALIIAGTTEVFLNHFVKGMDPFASVMAPRFYHQLFPNAVSYENWTAVSGDHFKLPLEIRRSLQKKGHVLQSLVGGTVCQLIVHQTKHSEANHTISFGKLTAVSDPRKGGFPAGF